eukprot:12870967-Alexandrium_andersonii.AAC.1
MLSCPRARLRACPSVPERLPELPRTRMCARSRRWGRRSSSAHMGSSWLLRPRSHDEESGPA